MEPDAILNAKLADLEGAFLQLACGATGHMVTFYPLKLMAREHGAGTVLRTLMPRFRCRSCRRPPNQILLCETPYISGAGMHGGTHVGWRIDLTRALPAVAAEENA